MFRRLIDSTSKFVTWVKRNRIYRPKVEVVKVNMGAGLSVADGWINVDASLNAFFSKGPQLILKMLYKISDSKESYSQEKYCDILKNHDFIHYNINYGIPFPSETVDYLYSSHLLEHLHKEDAKKLLREAHCVLKKGGIIRFCVPDLEYAIALYKKGRKEEALNYFFATSKSGYLSRHYYMYDFDMLRRLLEEAGFTNVERCSYRRGKTPDIDVLDNRPEETLYVEASK